MIPEQIPEGRRERAKADKRQRIEDAARELFAERGVGGVTTQQIADRADVAIGTLYLYAATKAELLILVQNRKFAVAIDDGLAALAAARGASTLDRVLLLVTPVVHCLREQPENGRTYLHELLFGDPSEPRRHEGLALSRRLESGLEDLVVRDGSLAAGESATLARVITSVLHVTTTATLHLADPLPVILDHLRRQIAVVLPRRPRPGPGRPPGPGAGQPFTAEPATDCTK